MDRDFDPLVSTDWLESRLGDPGLRVVDIRGYVQKRDLGGGRQEATYLGALEEYDEAHIPGAVYVDWTRDIVDPEDPKLVQVAPPEIFAGFMGDLGVGDGTHVVVYDHAGGQFATRLWWALQLYGHDRVSVLDGGWRKWTAEGRPVTAEPSRPEPAAFIPRPRPGWRVGAEEVLRVARGEDPDTRVLDARDEGQYTGEVARGEGRRGHVPGASHLHADRLLDPETGTMRSEEEVAALLREAGVPEDRDAPVVAYCNGGVAATVPLFAMYRLGYTNLANYDGSWNEWGAREDLPAEVVEGR
jgi:thiosulfate/3-mercaptopyruvate sulfurtransferase